MMPVTGAICGGVYLVHVRGVAGMGTTYAAAFLSALVRWTGRAAIDQRKGAHQ